MGSSSKTKSTQTQTVTPDPITDAWRADVFGRGSQMMNQGPAPFYPGDTVADFSPQTQGGLNTLQAYASNPAPNMGAAMGANARALSGWNPAMGLAAGFAAGGGVNPGLKSLFDQGAGQIRDAVNGNFMMAGRTGPNAGHTGALTREIGNLWNNIYVPAYENERNRALAGTELLGGMYSQANADAARAADQLPGLYAYGAMPAQLMGQVGSIYDEQNQAEIDANKERYDYTQNAPWQRLMEYTQAMSGMPYFANTTTNTTGKNSGRSIGWSFSDGLRLG